jgi:ABC-type lipoprotein release transport system permease subunit
LFSFGYAWNELRRRLGRTIVTAIGLAAGVGLVMGIIGVSQGLSAAQNKALSPLNSVGTDIIVTRTVAPTLSTATTTTTTPTNRFGGGGGGGGFGGGGGGGGGGGFFAGGGGSSLNSSDDAALAAANSSVITDLAKLGPAGTKFTHDFFVAGTLITFPSQAVSTVANVKGVKSAVGALSLDALHESGTVPKITASVKTGGETISANVKPPVLTAAEQATERSCIESLITKQLGSTTTTIPTGGGGGGGFGGGGGGRFRFGAGASSAFTKCLSPAQKAYEQNVVIPERTVNEVLNPPTTNTSTSTYTVGSVDPANTTSGLVTKAQLTKGTWLSTTPSIAKTQVLVTTSYASQKSLTVGETLTINKIGYKIVGLVNPTLTGDVSDIYFSTSNLQALSTNSGRINEVLVSVDNANDVNAVAKAIKKALPGATVLTAASLADQVTGSLSNARKLANDLGGALAVVVLLAAFLIAGLLTLSSVSKRVREIGSLRAIGWSRGRVVRQIMAETLGIGVVGGVIGVAIGAVICLIIGAVGPALSVTSTGLAVGASKVSGLLGQTTSATVARTVHLTAPIHPLTILIAFGGALLGGLIAGAVGGWRAARLSPASALRDIG